MPGRLCTGQPENNIGAGRLSQSKAYCEGMAYRASGTFAAKPVTDNPHVPGSPDAGSWDLGWIVADDASGGNVSKADLGCCAAVPSVPN